MQPLVFRLFVNSWGKEIKQNQQSKQLQSSGCLIVSRKPRDSRVVQKSLSEEEDKKTPFAI